MFDSKVLKLQLTEQENVDHLKANVRTVRMCMGQDEYHWSA